MLRAKPEAFVLRAAQRAEWRSVTRPHHLGLPEGGRLSSKLYLLQLSIVRFLMPDVLPMSRTFRRKHERHEYYWVWHDWDSRTPYGYRVRIDPQSEKGRKALAGFHSDKAVTMLSAALVPQGVRPTDLQFQRPHAAPLLGRSRIRPGFSRLAPSRGQPQLVVTMPTVHRGEHAGLPAGKVGGDKLAPAGYTGAHQEERFNDRDYP